jgi:hypothetical protein
VIRVPEGPADRSRGALFAHLMRRAFVPVLVVLSVWALAGFLVQVARQSVRQGLELQQVRELQHESHWRCQALRTRAARLRCDALVSERPPPDSATLQALVAEAVAEATVAP